LHLNFAKSAIMTPKNLSGKISKRVKKTQNFMLISNSLMPALKNSPKIAIAVRHVTGTGLGLLEEIPRSGVQMSALT
jgi:hypothetical protein